MPSYTRIDNEHLTVTNLRCAYSDVHDSLGPFDPYLDVFFAFSPGFGFPDEHDPQGATQLETNWHGAVTSILETKCALFCTGFSPADIERDVVALDKADGIKGEFDWLLTPGENVFSSEKWEIAEFDPRVAVKTNWGIWGIRSVSERRPMIFLDRSVTDFLLRSSLLWCSSGKRYEVRGGEGESEL